MARCYAPPVQQTSAPLPVSSDMSDPVQDAALGARQVADNRRAEVYGQQKPSNDPRNNHHNRSTPTTGHH